MGCMVMFNACKPTAVVPTEATSVNETAKIYPDYRDVVVPPNIAPLNVQVKTACCNSTRSNGNRCSLLPAERTLT